MGKFKRILAFVLALAAVLVMAGCAAEPDATGTTTVPNATTPSANTQKASYTVELKTQGGMALPGIDVYIYADNTLSDLKHFGQTNEYGKLTMELPQSGSYVAVLSGVPKGYAVDSFYPFTGSTAAITLTSQLLDEELAGASLGVGDVMYDFSVATPDGTIVKLSEMLEEKDMVLLNFWYTTCTYCVAEFPFMEQAYQQYIDSVGIIALNPMEQDPAIKSFQERMELTFPMAACPAAWSATFGISGYPTSILVDRYGVICLVEAGGITSLRPFVSLFDHFTGQDYEQKLFTSLSELVTAIKPTHTMDTSENVGAVLNGGDITVSYRPETDADSAEYAWPFIIGEKNGEKCLYASNQGIEESYAILYADVELKAGQAVGFDYIASTEKGGDILYVIVDGEDIYAISGNTEGGDWATCYPWVAEADGTYEVALCYIKDGDANEGDDTVYIKNMHITDASAIDVATYIPRQAAISADGFEYSYVDIVFNEADGYYHVGTADGPLLLADLMNYTPFNEETTVWEMAYNNDVVLDGHDYVEEITPYATHASNSALQGVCTVDKDLAEYLKIVAKTNGFDGTENEWLKICRYYQVYGTDGAQLVNPIQGLHPSCAYKATLGKNVDTNYFYYDRLILPRGLLAEFVPSRSGVYRITSRAESQHGVEGWIFDENRQELMVYQQDERLWNDSSNVSMVFYMEAGKPYYIDIAFWDMYEVGYIYYDIEYMGSQLDHFRLAAPGYFTYDSDATGDAMYYLIAGGIDVVLGTDGYYYEDLGKDAGGKQLYGSKLYCDFTGLTSVFSDPIASVPAYNADGTIQKDENGNTVMIKGMIEKNGFDFSKTENDLYVISFLQKYDNDVAATDAYLKELWGEDYETYAQIYQLQDVYEGIYHGEGEDLTQEISAYLDKIITTGSEEKIGCVPVDENLANILQQLMDKYTFENVDHSWIKLCYYYDHLGPNN